MTPLTSAQKATLRAAVLADPAASQMSDEGVAAWLNAIQASFIVWKTRVSEQDMHGSYVWSEMDNLSQAKFNQLTLLLKPGFINPSLANIRQGITDIFSGAQLANTRTALIALAKRQATLAEKLLAAGTGTTASPATMGAEGEVTVLEAGDIMRN